MKAIVLLCLLSLVCGAQVMSDVHLRNLHRLFVVPDQDGYGRAIWWELVQIETCKFDGRTQRGPVGDCAQGYTSRIPGVVLVCDRTQSDAYLAASGSQSDQQWQRQTRTNTDCTQSANYSNCSTTGGQVRSGVNTIIRSSAQLIYTSTGAIIWKAQGDNDSRLGTFANAMSGGLGSPRAYTGSQADTAAKIVKRLQHDFEVSREAP